MKYIKLSVMMLSLLSCTTFAQSDYVIEDKGVGMTHDELDYIVRQWTPDMQEAAANDLGDRLELLNMVLATKKIAEEANTLTPEEHGDVYWRLVFTLRTVARNFMVEHYLRQAEIPDMTKLARERYEVDKDKFAKLPEQRLSSHILIKCDPKGGCDREAAKAKINGILAELEAGASFEELAKEHSDDKRTGAAGGRYDRLLDRGNKQVAPEYVKAVFNLEKEGDISGVIPSRFGFHIIRLDEIVPEHYRSFEDSKDDIIAVLKEEYTELQAKAFDAKYRITDEAFINPEAMEDIFAPYKNKAPEQAQAAQ